jgi:hypothetical protein
MGQLRIADPSIWDPERGYAGLVLAVLAAALLWWWVKPSTAPLSREERLSAFNRTR